MSGVGRLSVLAVALLGTLAGYRTFWFLTDDSFIAFRYVSNARLGWGLTWNPPPFVPVEGYTSYLWVALLRVVWGVTGIEPPVAANGLSLLFGVATLLVVLRLVDRLALPDAWERRRLWLLALVLAGIVSNRTFLTWLSSGLETAMFNFAVAWWVLELLAANDGRGWRWVLRLSLASAMLALTRPDGMLYAAASVGVLAWCGARRPALRGLPGLLAAAPLLAIPAHLLWRRATYGLWLPNTFHAKVTGWWPEAGLRYLGCFVLEYGLWIGAIVALWAAVAWWRGGGRPAATLRRHGLAAVVVAVLTLHVAYYVLRVGGDHFEFRVFSHLIPLIWLAAAALAVRCSPRKAVAAALLVVFLLASLPIPWVHWSRTRHLETRKQTHTLVEPVADDLPVPLRPVAAVWDGWQAWLVPRLICVRHQTHKVYCEYQLARYPTREEGAVVSWDQHAVIGKQSVGVVGWVLPEVAVIDAFGLNDRVVARSTLENPAGRKMAHERRCPEGYVECFRPNVRLWLKIGPDGRHRHHGGRDAVEVRPRDVPLTDDDIRACEARDWLGEG